MTHEQRKPMLLEALLPVLFLIVLLAFNVFVFGDHGLDGSNQVVLMLATAFAGLVAYFRLHLSWKRLLHGMVHGIGAAMPSILILMLIGALAGSWLLGGIVPAMVYYGLKLIHPEIFLFASIITCAVVSLATGSSWSTIATVGLALIGIGETLGFNAGMVAGAIISGAYFGDKMSPLSDTTNLAPAVAGTDLFTHIRYMVYTTLPSFLIAALIFLFLGFGRGAQNEPEAVGQVLSAIETSFSITPWLFLAPVLVVILIIRKVPALPALMAGALAGVACGLVFQRDLIHALSGSEHPDWMLNYRIVMEAMYSGLSIPSDNQVVAELLSSSGITGMLNTIWLIIVALSFGGIMEVSGMLHRITESIIEKVKSETGLFASTVGTCLFFNSTASDQYLSIVIPGRMFSEAYKDAGLAPENLSRTLEDSATVTSVLVPWNTCGAAQSTVLGVSTGTYLPYCFFNIISPFMTLLMAALKIRIRRLKPIAEQESYEK